jgi:hypothetical protein
MAEQGSSKWHVFISCAKEDIGAAERVRERLRREGLHAFLFSEDINPNLGMKRWSELIDERLSDCGAMVLIASSASMSSKWVTYEWRTFDERLKEGADGTIIPVCIEGPGPEQRKFPLALKSYQVLDCRTGEVDDCFDAIIDLVKSFAVALQRRSSGLGDGSLKPPPELVLVNRPRYRWRRWADKAAAPVLGAAGLALGYFIQQRHVASNGPRSVVVPAEVDQADPPDAAAALAPSDAGGLHEVDAAKEDAGAQGKGAHGKIGPKPPHRDAGSDIPRDPWGGPIL